MRTYEIEVTESVKVLKKIQLADWARYIATDENGVTYQYSYEPNIKPHTGMWGNDGRRSGIRCVAVHRSGLPCEDWENSLVKLPSPVKKDTLVEVWFGESDSHYRYATGGFDEQGYILCYADGADSKTCGDTTPAAWENWEVVEESK